MNFKLTPIRRAIPVKEVLPEKSFTEARWKTNMSMANKIDENNRRLCGELNDFYRDVNGNDCRFFMINGKLHLLSSTEVKEIDDLTARQLIQDMRQGNKEAHFNTLI